MGRPEGELHGRKQKAPRRELSSIATLLGKERRKFCRE